MSCQDNSRHKGTYATARRLRTPQSDYYPDHRDPQSQRTHNNTLLIIIIRVNQEFVINHKLFYASLLAVFIFECVGASSFEALNSLNGGYCLGNRN